MSDWKWTGPAEPMLLLMRALRARGHVVELVCPAPPAGAGRSLAEEAAKRGLAPIASIAPGRSAWQRGDGARVRRLAQWLTTPVLGGPFDVVHTWHTRDHVLAARALGRLSLVPAPRAGASRLVRFASRAEPIPDRPWNRWLFGRACDGLLCVSAASASANRRVRPLGPIEVTPGAVDLEAFGVGESAGALESARARRRAACAALGLPEDSLLIGVVARLQAHRRFDLLFEALATFVRHRPEARLVLFGRGTRAEAVVEAPVRALGLEGHVVRAGYRVEDYAALVGGMDLFTFLVPGSDGTCRALREAAALGLPMVGTRRGAIPEIIVDGETGLLVDEDPASLVAAWERLAADPDARRAMGEAARRDARARFSPAGLAELAERFYAALGRSAPISSR
ncbi:MAG: glycosyltransferase family 4 protein [Deltaproteobacteria bacterium]|nr:glycosyltransferase family 4 protein [Deltaproteobacteria bacterium]